MSKQQIFTAKSSQGAKAYWKSEGIDNSKVKAALTYKGVNVSRDGKFVTAVHNGLQELQNKLFEKLVVPAIKDKAVTEMLREALDIGLETYTRILLDRASQNEAVRLNSGLPKLPVEVRTSFPKETLNF